MLRKIFSNNNFGSFTKENLTYAIAMLEKSDNIIHVRDCVVGQYEDWKGWPDIQHLPHGRLVRAEELEVGAECDSKTTLRQCRHTCTVQAYSTPLSSKDPELSRASCI